MNRRISILMCQAALGLSASAVPLRWTVETSRAVPATFEAYQGETLALEAALTSYGKPLEAPSNYSFFWQTNGMGNAFWSVPCNPPSTSTSNLNLMVATWSPTNDVGARVYNCFIGQPGTIYHAAFQLRLRPSPGATPNELPLPQKVIDFAKVTVLNPPWSGGGGGGGVDTNAVRDIVRDTLVTNGIRSVDGAARPLPKYLHLYNADDSYPDAAQEYYRSRGNGKVDGGCSSVRDGGFLFRNFDYPFDDRAEFVVRMSSSTKRFASVGVAQVGTNLTEQFVTSGKPSRWYKWLPGATVDGINENGVACNINVVDGEPHWEGGALPALHPLAAIRWILDNATNAQHAAEYIASHIAFPSGWTQNFHYMIADEEKTYIVENGICFEASYDFPPDPIMTNFPLSGDDAWSGAGIERYDSLQGRANITNAWYTNAYRRKTNPPWVSDLADVIDYTNDIYNAWAAHPKEYFRNKTTNGQPWWQTVHTSVYDLTNRVLSVAVQEVDDWYTFAVDAASIDAYTKSETDAKLAGKAGISDDGFIDGRVMFIGKLESQGGDPVVNVRDRVLDGGDWTVAGDVVSIIDGGHSLKSKANRPADFDPSHAGNIAALDGNGNLVDSGHHPDEINSINLQAQAAWDVANTAESEATMIYSELLPLKADRSMISATDPTFSNEVAEVARTVQPTKIRAYDRARRCWWVLDMVNGVPTWTVED